MGLGDGWGKAWGGLTGEALPVDPAALGSVFLASVWSAQGHLEPGTISWHGFSCHLESHYWSFEVGAGGEFWVWGSTSSSCKNLNAVGEHPGDNQDVQASG